jgi:hypothetical protein
VLIALTSPSSSAGLHRAGSLNSDQRCGSSISHSDTELPSVQNRDLVVSNIAYLERRNSAQTSSHDGSSPPTCPTVLLRTVTYDTLLFPDDTRRGIPIPRKHTNPEEGPQGISWGSLHSRPSFGDFNVHQCLAGTSDSSSPPLLSVTPDNIHVRLDYQQTIHNMRSGRSLRTVGVQSVDPEQIAVWREAEAQQNEGEATPKEDGARRKGYEALLREKARQTLMEAKRREVDARHAEASAKMREAAAQKMEAEAKRKEVEAKKWEADAVRQLEEARQRELEAHRKVEQAKRNEEQASKREEEARREEADARRREDDAQRQLEDAQQQETLARQMEEDARHFEKKAQKGEEGREKEHADLRPAQETGTCKALGSSRNELKEDKADRLKVTKANTANSSTEEVASAAPGQKKQPTAQDRARAKRQRDELEEHRRLEEERFLKEQGLKEMLQREREEQTRFDEELSLQEQEAILAVLGQERRQAAAQEKETKAANRLQEDHRRAGEERHRLPKEQRHKVAEQSRQRDRPRWQKQRHHDETLTRSARGQQQKEPERKDAMHYQRTMERERLGALSVPHPPTGPGPTTADDSRGGVAPIRRPSVRSTASSRSSH